MAKCEACGNEYDKTFDVMMGGKKHTFDCLECAVNTLAPACGSCGNRIIGHGVEAHSELFCCANCAREKGAQNIHDRA